MAMKQWLKNLVLRVRWRGRAVIAMSAVIGIGSRFEGADMICAHARFNGEMGYGSIVAAGVSLCAKVGRFTSVGPGVKSVPYTHPFKAPYATTNPMFYSLRKQCGETFATRQMADEVRLADPEKGYHVEIGSDCWIGEDALLVGGVKIGDGAVVLARAVVTKDVPPYAIVGGIPARRVGTRYDDDTVDWLLRTRWWERPIEWLRANWEAMCDLERLRQLLP